MNLSGLGGHDAIELGVLGEAILEGQNDAAIEQQTFALAALRDIGELVRGDAVTEENLDETIGKLKAFSEATGSVIAVTGAIDLVADSEKCYVIRNGKPEMGAITGTAALHDVHHNLF